MKQRLINAAIFAVIALGALTAPFWGDSSSSKRSSDLERCRPLAEHEIVLMWLEDGEVKCESHVPLLYGQGLKCPVKGACP